MADLLLIGQGKEVLKNPVLAEGAKGQGGDKLGAAPGQDAAHMAASLAHPADYFEALVGRDAAGDDQEYAFPIQHDGPGKNSTRIRCC